MMAPDEVEDPDEMDSDVHVSVEHAITEDVKSLHLLLLLFILVKKTGVTQKASPY